MLLWQVLAALLMTAVMSYAISPLPLKCRDMRVEQGPALMNNSEVRMTNVVDCRGGAPCPNFTVSDTFRLFGGHNYNGLGITSTGRYVEGVRFAESVPKGKWMNRFRCEVSEDGLCALSMEQIKSVKPGRVGYLAAVMPYYMYNVSFTGCDGSKSDVSGQVWVPTDEEHVSTTMYKESEQPLNTHYGQNLGSLPSQSLRSTTVGLMRLSCSGLERPPKRNLISQLSMPVPLSNVTTCPREGPPCDIKLNAVMDPIVFYSYALTNMGLPVTGFNFSQFLGAHDRFEFKLPDKLPLLQVQPGQTGLAVLHANMIDEDVLFESCETGSWVGGKVHVINGSDPVFIKTMTIHKMQMVPLTPAAPSSAHTRPSQWLLHVLLMIFVCIALV